MLMSKSLDLEKIRHYRQLEFRIDDVISFIEEFEQRYSIPNIKPIKIKLIEGIMLCRESSNTNPAYHDMLTELTKG